MSTVIKVENLSKQYRLGDVGTGTLSHDLKRWWYQVRGKEDPYLRIGETNDRTRKGESDYVWALKDINFEVKAGEVLGIIGRNGAGKSTLLKILSKTTKPTTGSIKVKGRIASLLEVGTGFHPELTGRENIYLNGAILGMTRREIQSKFDEIVDFSGVERYIDTPVKRYSSGMYVRLAFAVAAHLEPEILIVDEVLAVGDAEFQKKCLGKMKDVSKNEGRTVLFVSHNMGAIQKLCNEVLLMKAGRMLDKGQTDFMVKKYLDEYVVDSGSFCFANAGDSSKPVFVTKIALESNDEKIISEIPVGEPWKIKVYFKVIEYVDDVVIGVGMVDIHDTAIRTSWQLPSAYEPGEYVATFIEDTLVFGTGKYRILSGISKGARTIEYIDENMWFTISDVVSKVEKSVIKSQGLLLNQMKMNVKKIN